MTTVIAIIAGWVFFNNDAWLAFGLTVVLGVLQAGTKSAMNAQFRAALHLGLSNSDSIKSISNRMTQANMAATFALWSLVIYAAVSVAT